MVDLETLEEKLKQPVTKDNWKDILLSILVYGILRYGFDEAIYPYREVRLKVTHQERQFKPFLLDDPVDSWIGPEFLEGNPEDHMSMNYPYLHSYSNTRLKAVTNTLGNMLGIDTSPYNLSIAGLVNSCVLLFEEDENSSPTKLFFDYINHQDITDVKNVRQLSYLLRLYANLKRYSLTGEGVCKSLRIILNKFTPEDYDDLQGFTHNDYAKNLDDFLGLLLLASHNPLSREFLSLLINPTEPFNDDLEHIALGLSQDPLLETIRGMIYRSDIGNSGITPFGTVKENTFYTFLNVHNFASILINDFDEIELRDGKEIVGNYLKKRLSQNILGEQQEIIRDTEFVLEVNEPKVNDLSRFIHSYLFLTRKDIQTMSRRARIIKILREIGEKVDYNGVRELAKLNVPEHLAIAKRGEGITSIVYECTYDRLDVRPRALRIFDLRDPEHSTTLEGVRKDYGDFEIFKRGMVFQEELGRDYDFVVKVYSYGKLENGTYYSIEELIDWTLEDELKLRQEVRESMFSRTFQEVARRLCILHEGTDPGETQDYYDLDEDVIAQELDYLKRKFNVDRKKRISEPITHCDIKLSNIGRRKGEVKLLDFQTAVVGSRPITATHFCGTRRYAAPESILHNLYSTQSDVYSLGVCMYRYLTGRFPTDYGGFNDGRESLEHLRKRLERTTDLEHYRQIRESREELTIHAGIIGDALNWNPNRRISARRLYLTFSKVENDMLRILTKKRPEQS